MSTLRRARPQAADLAALAAAAFLAVILLLALAAPLLGLADPLLMAPAQRLRPPSAAHWFGTDVYGRDVFSRVVHGARVSLAVGLVSALLCLVLGLAIGLVAGFLRPLDPIAMRIMDGLMAIPPVLLAVALAAVGREIAHPVVIVVAAITVPETPRVVRLARSMVLSIRVEPFVEAARSVGTTLPMMLLRHVLPSTLAPMTVQTTFVAASAMLSEATLSFLGAGMPPEIPSWGNMIGEGRALFPVAPRLVLLPGLFLALTILAVNIVGDWLRDRLEARFATRLD